LKEKKGAIFVKISENKKKIVSMGKFFFAKGKGQPKKINKKERISLTKLTHLRRWGCVLLFSNSYRVLFQIDCKRISFLFPKEMFKLI